MKTRIIAKLDVKPPYIVKPVHFEGLRQIGTPLELAKKYYEQNLRKPDLFRHEQWLRKKYVH